MEKINADYAYSSNYRKVTNVTSIDYTNKADAVMQLVEDLIDDPKYKPFFFKRLYAIGPQRFLDIADRARVLGFNKGRMFVKLLKEQPNV